MSKLRLASAVIVAAARVNLDVHKAAQMASDVSGLNVFGEEPVTPATAGQDYYDSLPREQRHAKFVYFNRRLKDNSKFYMATEYIPGFTAKQ